MRVRTKSTGANPEAAYTGEIPNSYAMEQLLEKAKVQLFLRKNAAFLGSLLGSHEFQWDLTNEKVPTAATDGKKIYWGTKDFMRCSKKERVATLVHELWHTGRMHMARRQKRNPRLWNIACDIRINNDMIYEGYDLPDNGWWVFDTTLDHEYDPKFDPSEEQIYDLLLKDAVKIPPQILQKYEGDMTEAELTPIELQQLLMVVSGAISLAVASKEAGSLPGSVKKMFEEFTSSIIPWKAQLGSWFTSLGEEKEPSWSRPNRRYSDGEYPGSIGDICKLGKVHMFVDISGSISDEDINLFNSEVKFILEELKPEVLTVLFFDTEIHEVYTFHEGESFNRIEITGRGGTDLHCIQQRIEADRPDGVIVLTDLYCAPMQPLSHRCKLLWAVLHNPTPTVLCGEVLIIK